MAPLVPVGTLAMMMPALRADPPVADTTTRAVTPPMVAELMLRDAGDRGSPILMDDEVIGFGVQVRKTGRKSSTRDCGFDGRVTDPNREISRVRDRIAALRSP